MTNLKTLNSKPEVLLTFSTILHEQKINKFVLRIKIIHKHYCYFCNFNKTDAWN